ncbi:hypothetical protein LguiA_005106 [Lonicera macranthoides]
MRVGFGIGQTCPIPDPLPSLTTWLAFLLYELGALLQFPISLHCDNLSATYMASNPVFQFFVLAQSI